MPESLSQRAKIAAKWSLLTELIARIIAPVTQLILARLLAPDAFGVVATVVMVTSFVEMLSDAGFQKYLIQREFADPRELDENANVAFWSSIGVASTLLVIIAVFRDSIARVAGNPGLGTPILVASCALPLTVFVSTQQALFRRALEFKKVLPIRVASSLVTLVVAVPLAIIGFGYWALIFGVMGSTLVNAVALTAISPWKPRFFYSIPLLREMFSFSGWSLLEAISIWLTTWAGTFIVSNLLTPHELGLYRQPMMIINSMFALVTSATTPILFSALSRLQSDDAGFRELFLRFQFGVSLFVLPLGVGTFIYRDALTSILLGAQWSEASLMLGAWSLSSAFTIVFSHYCSEIYRSLGKPRISLFSQVAYMAFMVPALYLAARDGFVTLVIVNSSVRVVGILINQVLTYLTVNVGILNVLRNLRTPLVAVAVMGLSAVWITPNAEDVVRSIVGIAVSASMYLAVCSCFRDARTAFLAFLVNMRAERKLSTDSGRAAEAAGQERDLDPE